MTSNGWLEQEWIADRDRRKLPTSKWAKDILAIQHTDGKVVFVATNGVVYKPEVARVLRQAGDLVGSAVWLRLSRSARVSTLSLDPVLRRLDPWTLPRAYLVRGFS